MNIPPPVPPAPLRPAHPLTWLSLPLSLVAAAIPWVVTAHALPDKPGFATFVGSCGILPPLMTAGMAWATRTDRRTARIVAVVSVVNLAVSAAAWSLAASVGDRKAVSLAGMLVVPAAQLTAWLGGAIVSGRGKHEPT